ncbi:Rossmann-like and DUF2520 domain-containing protein [Lewinella sp. 4G2]|uniref:Rossmann-like and DUF2520 domain-containing protein n=1 Tax=Lewinella sp. 4G2 TaxID=1803372 RepID=UPI0007B496D4|nr:Rossmann-like and DUF2520 domain-containing protein [Lewinella sp. 4G2]OAV45365.1 hypothetical protein A3850_013070 [Lewinella sp. 4G2]
MNKIAVIGTGNLAWHIVPALKSLGHQVVAVSRHTSRSHQWPVRVIDHAGLVRFAPDTVVLAVPDKMIAECSRKLSHVLPPSTLVIHTSGATAMKKIDGHFENKGVIWPIRSLRKGTAPLPWTDLPVAYQGNNDFSKTRIRILVDTLTQISYSLDSQQRARLHLAAVYSNNFTNWLYQISYDLCEEMDIPFEALLPIIKNTALRQDGTEPKLLQTGAAARDDKPTMDKHLKLLNGHPEFARLYRLLSNLIQEGVED